MLTRLRRLSRNVYAQYTFLFSAIFVLGFVSFFINGRSFISNVDGIQTWFPVVQYSGRYFREIINSIFSGNFNLSLFDFRIGLGDDPIRTLYYGSFNIINLFNIFIPASVAEQAHDILLVLRFYLAGITFLLYSKYMKIEKYPAIIGALAYVFSGWMIYEGFAHPLLFLDAAIYTPLVVLGLDKVLTGGRPLVLLVSMFLFALTGFYWIYMVLLFFIPYTLIRVHQLYPKKYFTNLLKMGGYAVVLVLISLLTAALQLLPQFLFQFENIRGAGMLEIHSFRDAASLLFFNDLRAYSDFFMNLISLGIPYHNLEWFPAWNQALLPAVVVVALLWLIFSNSESDRGDISAETSPPLNKKHLFCLLIVLVVMRLTPLGGYIMHGFAYHSNRWVFIMTFIFAFIIAKAVPHAIYLKGRLLYAAITVTVLYGVVIALFSRYQNIHYYIGAILLFVMVLLLCIGSKMDLSKRTENAKQIFLLLFVSANLIININLLYSGNFMRHNHNFIERGTILEHYIYSPIPQNIRIPEDGFHRIDVIASSVPNAPLVNDYFGLSSYQSLQNPYFMRFMAQMENTPRANFFFIDNLGHSAILNSILSAQYTVTFDGNCSRVPYGHRRYYYTDGGLTVFRNTNSLPFGFTYRYAIAEEDFINIDPVTKQYLMMHAVVLEEAVDNRFENIMQNSQVIHIPYSIYKNENIAWENGILHAEANNELTLAFEGLANSEIYVRLVEFDSGEHLSGAVRFTGDVFTVARGVGFSNCEYGVYYQRNQTVNMGYSFAPQTYVSLSFPEGIFELANIEIYALPLDTLTKRVAELGEEQLTDIRMGREGGVPGLTNSLSGDITVSGDRYLFLSIPYSRGWSATVNGEASRLMRANIGFMALELSEGDNYVELNYQTPGIRLGFILSILGVAGFIAAVKFHDKILKKIDGRVSNADK